MQLFESDVEELKALLCVHVCGVVGGGECVCVCVCVQQVYGPAYCCTDVVLQV